MINVSMLLKGFTRPFDLVAARQQTPAASKLLASYLGIWSPHFPLDIALRDGGLVRVFSRGEAKVFWAIFVRECYRLWADCETIVDAGANIGVFSLWAAKRLPQARIFAFEPCPDTFSKLQLNLQVNAFGSRVQATQLALGATCGEREMWTGAESQRRSLVPSDRHGAEGQIVKVRSITLEELMDHYQLARIDLLKMDIEGSEWEVLLSTPISVLRHIRRIEFEYHEVHARFGYSKAALFSHLASAGLNLTHCHEDKHGTGIAVVEQASSSYPVLVP
jgi:FkbM family methyltransferase